MFRSENSPRAIREWRAAALFISLLATTALAGEIDPGLSQVLESKRADELVSVLVFLNDRADLAALEAKLDTARPGKRARHEAVVRALQDKSRSGQSRFREHLVSLKEAGRVTGFVSFWLVNALKVDAPAREIRQLARHPDVDTIYLDYPVELVEPVDTKADDAGPRSVEPGIIAINVPQVWDLGYTGNGMLVATVDSGVDGHHPALASRWAGTADPRYAGHPEWAWNDLFNGEPFPVDAYEHGTHTMGTLCGGQPGDQIGVAPGACWISACNYAICTSQFVSNSILGLQWIADPDGDPATDWDVPAVCSNSWGVAAYDGYPPCDELFWTFIDACEAAGVVVVFSAGNDSGAGPGRPADRATDAYNTFAIGAVDANAPGWPLAPFSALGPTNCTPTGLPDMKPELVAPGVDVRSAKRGGGYQPMSGTSMAAPHVAGVIALMRQACPCLTVREVKQILYDTAVDLGDPGEDNEYGWGMMDAMAAVTMALDVCSPRPPYAWDGSHMTDANLPIRMRLRATDDGLPDPPGKLTYVIKTLSNSGGLIDPVTGPITEVPHALAEFGDEVTYCPNVNYQGPDSFTFVAHDGGQPPHEGESNIATITLTVGRPKLVYHEPLDEDPGWAREGEWAFGQPTGQGGTNGYPDPTSGATGPNVYGINLDGDYLWRPAGPDYLTSPPLDFTDVTHVTLRFQRWLNCDAVPFACNTVEVSNDGVDWVEVWGNGRWRQSDNCWRPHEYDVAMLADNQPAVRVRWRHQTGAMVAVMSGWNIDDVQFWGLVPPWAPGDLDGDGDVDFDDFCVFATCLAGSDQVTPPPGCKPLDFERADLDGDGDVDLHDFADFQQLFTGA